MTNLSDYFDIGNFYDTSDATVVMGDLPIDVIAYGAAGRLVGTIPFSAVKLLLHMNGSDASTTFTDDSNSAHTVTPGGDAQLDTADKKFGTASGLLDGTGDNLAIPYVVDEFDWFNSSYTIEAWVKTASSWTQWRSGSPNLSPNLVGRMNVTSSTAYWSFGPMHDGTVQFYYFNGSQIRVTSVATLSTGAWHHIAMTYDSTTANIDLWLNGVNDGSAAKVGTPQSATENLSIGQQYNASLNGWIDDLRITYGYARYTEAFTPPTEQFADA